MLKNITLSAEELLIKKAREKALNEQKSLNVLFREWLKKYLKNTTTVEEFDRFMMDAKNVNSGGKFSREEMNAR